MGAPAARSVLLTILGEYVRPLNGGVWQESLVKALEQLGYKTHAARQAIARSVSGGWLETERCGRRSRLTLTPPTRDMLGRGAARIYSFGEEWDWDGRWLLLVMRVPEERREIRHQARTQLAWSGFGSLGGGLWISPHTDREGALGRLVDEAGVTAVQSFRAELGELGDPRRLIAEAWDTDAVARAYKDFVATFGRVRARDDAACFAAQTRLVHEWRRFPFVDPDLPSDVLPSRWPRRRAYELFHARHAAWADGAQAFFRALESGDA